MLHIPALRFGQHYQSLESARLVHHRTGEPIAEISQVGAGLIGRDFRRMPDARRTLARWNVRELVAICAKAAGLYANESLPLGGHTQSAGEYVRCLSATTGMPVALCRRNMEKIAGVLSNTDAILAGLTRGLPLEALDELPADARTVAAGSQLPAYRAETDCLGCILPSNSPGVHGLWIPAIPLKIPLVIKPGREEPWTPLRMAAALILAGCPPEAFSYYPADHAGAAEILRLAGRSMLFGDASTTQPYAGDPRVQLHGPGFSKVLIADDEIENWPGYVELLVSSIAENGGRSCLNASAIWVPSHAAEIANAVAAELAKIEALPAEDERARLAAFANPATAEHFDKAIEGGLATPGAEDVTARCRRGPRLAKLGNCAYVLPTLVRCRSPEHPLANREFLLPYAAVVECPQADMLSKIGSTLVCTAITRHAGFVRELRASRNIDRLNIGPIPTWRISWDQPHEGNLFEHLYRRRALQVGWESA